MSNNYANWQYCSDKCPRNCTTSKKTNRKCSDKCFRNCGTCDYTNPSKYEKIPNFYELERGPNQEPPFLKLGPTGQQIYSFPCYNKPKLSMDYDVCPKKCSNKDQTCTCSEEEIKKVCGNEPTQFCNNINKLSCLICGENPKLDPVLFPWFQEP